jgi:hypothetical protein
VTSRETRLNLKDRAVSPSLLTTTIHHPLSTMASPALLLAIVPPQTSSNVNLPHAYSDDGLDALISTIKPRRNGTAQVVAGLRCAYMLTEHTLESSQTLIETKPGTKNMTDAAYAVRPAAKTGSLIIASKVRALSSCFIHPLHALLRSTSCRSALVSRHRLVSHVCVRVTTTTRKPTPPQASAPSSCHTPQASTLSPRCSHLCRYRSTHQFPTITSGNAPDFQLSATDRDRWQARA